MYFIKHVMLFININLVQLRRKWLSLPLLFLFPLLLLAMITVILISLIPTSDEEPIEIGLVDQDESKETRFIVEFIAENEQLGSFIKVHHLTESEAVKQIEADEISSYIMFPENFTANLYEGNSVHLAIIGNPQQATESHLIKELLESVTRHISASQANILTINYYAKELNIDVETRNELLFEHFKSFLVYALGKDKVIQEQEVTNHATASPLHYFGLAALFTVITLWLLITYNSFYKDEARRLEQRIKLYGVTQLQQICSKLMLTLLITFCFTLIALIPLLIITQMELYVEDYMRIAIVLFLHSIIFIQCLAIIELLITSQTIRLLTQLILTFILFICSGAMIPTIYLPLSIQAAAAYVFTHQAFYWLQEIILNDRLYVDYVFLLGTTFVGSFCLIGISLWKERVDE